MFTVRRLDIEINVDGRLKPWREVCRPRHDTESLGVDVPGLAARTGQGEISGRIPLHAGGDVAELDFDAQPIVAFRLYARHLARGHREAVRDALLLWPQAGHVVAHPIHRVDAQREAAGPVAHLVRVGLGYLALERA